MPSAYTKRASETVRAAAIELIKFSADFSANQKDARNYGDIKGTLDDDPRNGWTTKGESNRSIHRAVFALAETLKGDEATGARMVAKSLEGPLKQIAENAGMEGGVVVEKVRNMKGNEGLNAATGEYEDLVKLGVIDAAKVTRSALQNAGSIAALFLTTEAVIADKPADAAPAMPGGGMEDY